MATDNDVRQGYNYVMSFIDFLMNQRTTYINLLISLLYETGKYDNATTIEELDGIVSGLQFYYKVDKNEEEPIKSVVKYGLFFNDEQADQFREEND